MKLQEFDYVLPKASIAQRRRPDRDCSRMLVLSESISHHRFYEFPEFLRKGDVVVLNDSKVIPARLCGRKESGGKAEILVIRKRGELYECIVKRRVRKGTIIMLDGGRAEVVEQGERCLVSISGNVKGEMPVPGYIRERVDDYEDYQTAYAKTEGSIAAPTAGFHFTDAVLKQIEKRGAELVFITLHVSIGTFLPVICSDITMHRMQPEEYFISEEAAEQVNRRKGRLMLVGTTTLKALESAADSRGRIRPGRGISDLFIYPGYGFKTKADALLTNFHLPKSTLIMLASAFAGHQRLMRAYQAALDEGYSFCSFGDAMLVLNSQPQ